jgi:anti-sigma factor RsiW
MKCSMPPALTDDQISMLLDGATSPSLLEHVAACSGCAARVTEAKMIERSLHAGLHRWDCPPSQQLGDYHLGLLPRTSERTIMRHLESCAACRAEIEDLRVFLTAGEEAPAPIPAPVRTPQRRPRLGELIARLMPHAAAPALRGTDDGPLMAETDDGTTLILDMQRDQAGQVTISGQLVVAEQAAWTGALVELRVLDQLVATATVDDLGCFQLARVPAQQAELRITASSQRSIVLPDLELAQ